MDDAPLTLLWKIFLSSDHQRVTRRCRKRTQFPETAMRIVARNAPLATSPSVLALLLLVGSFAALLLEVCSEGGAEEVEAGGVGLRRGLAGGEAGGCGGAILTLVPGQRM